MNLLLVYANTHTLLWPQPAGLSFVARAAREAGHTVHVVDLMFEKDPDAVLAAALGSGTWDLVGLSLRNLDNAEMRKPISFVEDHVRRVSMAMRVAPTVIGGPALTAAPEALYRRTGATWALAGHAERSFPRFLEEVAAGATSFTTPGVLWREGEAIRVNPPDLAGHDAGIDWSVIDRKRYARTFMAYGLVTKSGCDHRCTFCDARTTDGPFACREPEAIAEDLVREARDYRLNRREYFFTDACFNQPLDWAKRVLEAIARSGVKIAFSCVVEPTPDLDAEFCRLMRRAGNTMITGLVGALHDDPLSAQGRPFRLDDVAHAFERFENAGVLYMPQFMFGGPGETPETVSSGLAFLARFKPIMVYPMYGVRVYPQAALRARAVAEGQVSPDDDLLDPRFYLAPGLDPAWLEARLGRVKAPFWSSMWDWTRYMARMARLWV
ncbi:MAG: cobalamin-dependent protein [Deltaproteobacteria bacterium]|nr:cobalamin-dependent protein [Deltaproteobacteria bacterium]